MTTSTPPATAIVSPRRSQRITLRPEVLRWARERAKFSADELANKVKVKPERVLRWEDSGEISVAQVDRLAHVTHTPLGFLYLAEPPERLEVLPINDFRTVGDQPPRRPSPGLLETVYAMQRRQAWMRDELIRDEVPPLTFVGAFTTAAAPETVAEAMRETLGLEHAWAAECSGWGDALRFLWNRIESAGVLVVFNGIVGNNTRRKLLVGEFRGFVLVDDYAPLIFINNADYKSAQMFTLAHELAHIFIGEGGVINLEKMQPTAHETEEYCNRVAAEFLIPKRTLRDYWSSVTHSESPYQAVAKHFKVSIVVAARRALDLELIDQPAFHRFYDQYLTEERERRARENEAREAKKGGNFWATQKGRIGRRFGLAVARAVQENRLSQRDAYALTGLRGDRFEELTDKANDWA